MDNHSQAHDRLKLFSLMQLAVLATCTCYSCVAPSSSQAADQSDILDYVPAIIKATKKPVPPDETNKNYTLIAWNDLGMHCMDPSYEDFSVLPPYNTLRAQVIHRGDLPSIVTQGITVEYRILNNTDSTKKTNFWEYAHLLFGLPTPLTPNIGLTGFGLSGQMKMEQAEGFFIAEGIPLTEYRDQDLNTPYPYQMAELVAKNSSGQIIARTQTVAPVSTEMHCEFCHGDNGRGNIGIATGVVKQNILTLHDQHNGTKLMNQRPVLCASCHSSNALGTAGTPGVPNLSLAIHGKHSSIDDGTMDGTCYQCHPGPQTKCLRDVMFQAGYDCYDCHGTLTAVANPNRRPWLDEPRCTPCHAPEYGENSGTLYRLSKGHQGIFCEACHGSPHAITPTVEANDNVQAIRLQGHAGTINTCTVCHVTKPTFGGPHHDIPMHPIGNAWVSGHQDANKNDCAKCHGTTSAGTPYSAVKVAITINAGEYGIKTWAAGYQVSCYSCHNGPNP